MRGDTVFCWYTCMYLEDMPANLHKMKYCPAGKKHQHYTNIGSKSRLCWIHLQFESAMQIYITVQIQMIASISFISIKLLASLASKLLNDKNHILARDFFGRGMMLQ